jgi:hypothetical protein
LSCSSKEFLIRENEELLVICDWLLGEEEEAAFSCGRDILSQAVLGASCSKFWEAKEEVAYSSTSDLRL